MLDNMDPVVLQRDAAVLKVGPESGTVREDAFTITVVLVRIVCLSDGKEC